MKKRIFSGLLFVIIAVLSFRTLLYAEDTEEMGMMSAKMKGMHAMMQMMMEKSVVATSDGGVVVVAGNKMTKYNKDLNVVKEAEIKMDMEAMGQQMQAMMGQCPMMKKMNSESGAAAETPSAADSGSEGHETHH